MTKDIRTFLLECIAEDEAVAEAAIDPSGFYTSPDGEWCFIEVDYEGQWPMNPDQGDEPWSDSEWALHASRFDPARVLAECAAKRAFLEEHAIDDHTCVGVNVWIEGCPTLRALAAIYSDHPDYNMDWAVA